MGADKSPSTDERDMSSEHFDRNGLEGSISCSKQDNHLGCSTYSMWNGEGAEVM